jgi:hypothetical protein
MGWINMLRQMEQEGRGIAQRGLEKARAGWDDAERRLRRKMRIFPGTRRNASATAETRAGAGTRTSTDTDRRAA